MPFHDRFHPRSSRGLLFVAALLVGATLPTGVAAQGGIRLLPQVGVASPLSDVTQVRDGGASLFEAGKKSSSLALGLAVELGGATGGTALRGQVSYATSSDLPIGGLECEVCDARLSLLTATAALVLRPLPTLAFFRPYVLAGGGVKRYDFDPRSAGGEDGWSAVLRDQTRFSGQVGAGLELSLLGLNPSVELSAHLSRFEPGEAPEGSEDSDFQTDLFLLVGIPLGG